MSAADYKTLRESMKKTPAELAEALGVEPNVVSRRELGEIPVSKEAEIAINQVAGGERRRRRSPVMFF